jgi:branched-chain amino acid transport system ATP-binding protein
VVLLGTNGNGKSTLMKCVMGMVRPSAGQHRRRDRRPEAPIWSAAAPRRSSISDRAGARGTAAVPEVDRRGEPSPGRVPAPGARRDRGEPRICYETFPRLLERRRQLAGSMSGGEQQMLALARALMSAPRILLIDEPSVGLAPILVSRTIEKIKELKDRSS